MPRGAGGLAERQGRITGPSVERNTDPGRLLLGLQMFGKKLEEPVTQSDAQDAAEPSEHHD